MTVTTLTTEFGGRTITIETGKLARLAGGAVTVQYGDTMLLGTANRAEPRPGLDFFPLTIDFEERMYAAGKIPGGFIKREARPSEAAILAARLTDRPIRPLFPKGYKDDVQCVLTVLSTDQENNPDILGTIAASAALTISEIPFLGPVGAVRVGRIDGQFVVNPTASQMDESELDLIVSGTRDAIMMVEAGATILPESVMADAIMFGHQSIQPVIDLQEQLREQVGKTKRIPYIEPAVDSVVEFVDAVDAGEAFVVFDTETTSKDPRTGELVEIAAVRIAGGTITDRFETLVKPTRGIVGKQIHGITEADVKGAPAPAAAARALLDFAGDDILVGHNVGFDIGFIEAALADGTHIEPGTYLDTLVLARAGYPGSRRPQAGGPDRLLRAGGQPQPSRPGRCRGHGRAARPHGPGPAGPCQRLQVGRRRLHPPAQGWRRQRCRRRCLRGRAGGVGPVALPDHAAAQEDRARGGAQGGHPHRRA